MRERSLLSRINTGPPSSASSVAPYHAMSCFESTSSDFFVTRVRLACVWIVPSVYVHCSARLEGSGTPNQNQSERLQSPSCVVGDKGFHETTLARHPVQPMQHSRKFNRTRTTHEERLGDRGLYWPRRRLQCCHRIEARPNLAFPIEMGN